jgi:hypothetical protein
MARSLLLQAREHINIPGAYPEVNSHPIAIIFISIKTEFHVVLLYNFQIIFYDKHFVILSNMSCVHLYEPPVYV